MTTRADTLTGATAALATAFLLGDEEAFGMLLDGLAPIGGVLPLLLAEAGVLLRDAACASVRLAIHRPADDIDVARAWQDCSPDMGCTLARLHGFEPADLGDWLDWVTGVILEDDTTVPACDWSKYLALTLSLIGEMFAGHPLHEWQNFLLSRTP